MKTTKPLIEGKYRGYVSFGGKYTSTGEELLARIQDYLGNGGLFNPEAMDHDKVRDLIIDCREYISAMTEK